MRVLLTNEPRSYREIFAGAFRALRPHVEVITAEPETVEEVTSRLHPDAVVCSNATPALQTAIDAWMEVRLEDGTLRVRASDTGGFQDTNPSLQTLLAFVDRSEEEARKAGEAHAERRSKTQ